MVVLIGGGPVGYSILPVCMLPCMYSPVSLVQAILALQFLSDLSHIPSLVLLPSRIGPVVVVRCKPRVGLVGLKCGRRYT